MLGFVQRYTEAKHADDEILFHQNKKATKKGTIIRK